MNRTPGERVAEREFTIRPATAGDGPDIRSLVRLARINPIGLDWVRFVVAGTPEGELIGCGQIKTHADGSRELASIAVFPRWRGRGAARAIIEHLLVISPGTLYLTCRSSLGPFYEKFGFRAIGEGEMPGYFRRIYRLIRVFGVLPFLHSGLLVMKRGNQKPPTTHRLSSNGQD